MRRCRECGGSGHNRRTCPNLSAQRQQEKAVGGTSFRRHAACSYCKSRMWKIDKTHNKSSCPERKKARDEWVELNSSWAFKHKQEMMNLGFGIGSIVQWGGESDVYVIVDMEPEYISRDYDRGYIAEPIEHLEKEGWYRYKTRIPSPSEDTRNSPVVLSKIEPERVASQYPKDWEYGVHGVPGILRDTVRSKRKKKE